MIGQASEGGIPFRTKCGGNEQIRHGGFLSGGDGFRYDEVAAIEIWGEVDRSGNPTAGNSEWRIRMTNGKKEVFRLGDFWQSREEEIFLLLMAYGVHFSFDNPLLPQF